mmetsp:Transcript_12390/g.20614  ORF Transcript_12390/g.20614 Transcript_12390/m.20614 type:complete len:132 (-) Transcript_12390:1109-1504(-)
MHSLRTTLESRTKRVSPDPSSNIGRSAIRYGALQLRRVPFHSDRAEPKFMAWIDAKIGDWEFWGMEAHDASKLPVPSSPRAGEHGIGGGGDGGAVNVQLCQTNSVDDGSVVGGQLVTSISLTSSCKDTLRT